MSINNETRIIGNLGQDPEFIATEGGRKILNFNVATSRVYKSSTGEEVKETDWHTCIIFGNYAEAMKDQMKKGSQVLVIAEIKYRTFENKAGIEVRVCELIVSSIFVITK